MHSNQLGTKNLKQKKKKKSCCAKEATELHCCAQNKKKRAKTCPFQCVWHGSKINHNHISLIKSSWRKV